MASSLPPIASPAARRWREFRIQVLPGIAFACIVAVVLALWNDCVTLDRPAEPVDTNLVTTASTPAPLRPAGRSVAAKPEGMAE
jgi:hypothetical protein